MLGLAILALLLCATTRPEAQEVRPTEQGGSVAPLREVKLQPAIQPRQFSAIAHDSVHNQFLLFGGTYGVLRYSDTWLLTSAGWRNEITAANPSLRISAAAAYDSLRSQFVLFGGRVEKATPELCSPGAAPTHLKTEFFCADTWIFNGQDWIKKSPNVSPSAREGHAMAFDAANNLIVLFGGTASGSSTPLNDTWLWNGITWYQFHPAHSPPARLWHSMAYDPVHKQVVLFGGDSGSEFLNDTWLWNGTDWQQAPKQTAVPAPRTSAGLDYDAATGTMVLFSGTTWNAKRVGEPATDSWSWNGTQWNQLPASTFQLISNFSNLTAGQAAAATLANGTPSLLWLPVTPK